MNIRTAYKHYNWDYKRCTNKNRLVKNVVNLRRRHPGAGDLSQNVGGLPFLSVRFFCQGFGKYICNGVYTEQLQRNHNVIAVRVAWRFFGFLMAGAKWLGWAVKTVPTSPICTVGTQTKTNIPDFCWDFDWSSVPHETNPRVTS